MTKIQSIHCKAVFFDAEGTLFRVQDSVGEIYARVAECHGVVADPQILNARFKEALTSKPSLIASGGEKRKAERDRCV